MESYNKGKRAKDKYIKSLNEFKECCGTCEFNFGIVCAGGRYGEEITNLDDVCESFHVGMGTFIEFGSVGKLDLLTRRNKRGSC